MFNIWDVLGRCGGVVDIIVSILGIFIFPINSFNFVFSTIKKFYFIKTSKVKKYSFLGMDSEKKNLSFLTANFFN